VIVLDASAVLALLGDERGASEVAARIAGALISTVNLAEVLQKAAQNGVRPRAVQELMEQVELGVVPFDDSMALAAAELWSTTKHKGLSLADRACLALAQAVTGVALTMDRAWAGLEIEGVDIHVVQR
jgi:PIN domain nuclease of toxin-antitoxin system